MTDYEKFEAGEYKVRWTEFFPTSDEDMMPIPRARTWGGEERLVLMYHTELEELDELDNREAGPPGSIDVLRELPLFVRALGVDPKLLPSPLTVDNMSEAMGIASDVLKQLDDEGNPCGKFVTATVGKKGWISKLEGMTPMDGSYFLKWGWCSTLDEDGKPTQVPDSRNPKWGDITYSRMVIAAGEFEGCPVPISIPYIWVLRGENLNLPIKKDRKTGETGPTKNRERIGKFFKLLCDVPLEAEEGPCFQPDELGLNHATAAMVKHIRPNAVVAGEVKNGWTRIDWLMKLPEGAEVKTVPSDQGLRDVFTRRGGDVLEDGPDWKWTAEGRKWAGRVLGKICDEHGLDRKVGDWTPDQRMLVYDILDNEND